MAFAVLKELKNEKIKSTKGSNPKKKLKQGKKYLVKSREDHSGVILVSLQGVSGKFDARLFDMVEE